MPALLPQNLESYQSAKDEDELLQKLTPHVTDLIAFFKVAVDDEEWRVKHSSFIQKTLEVLTKHSFEDTLLLNDKISIQQKIHEHASFITLLLHSDITFEVDGEKFPVNSLLFSSASPYFQDFIRNKQSVLDGISIQTFRVIEEFVISGDVPDLWKIQENDLKKLHHDTSRLGLTGLGVLCENVLKRYITRDNVLVMLIQAHLDGWMVLRQACYDKINGLNLGFKFHETTIKFLAFEFFDYKANAMDVFNQVKHLITHLYVSGKLVDDKVFSDVVNKCPLLIGLNLGAADVFSERIFDAPRNLKELRISSCYWLEGRILKRIVDAFKDLKALDLSDNIQLDYNSWGMLSSLKKLVSLTISRNPQINDDDFKLICQACPQIIELDCSDCKRIGDKGFYELTRSLGSLIFLNLENSQISDGILIEIAVKSLFLEEINLTRCQLLTDRGFIEFVKQSRSLRKMICKQCHIKEQTITEIKRQKNNLTLII